MVARLKITASPDAIDEILDLGPRWPKKQVFIELRHWNHASGLANAGPGRTGNGPDMSTNRTGAGGPPWAVGSGRKAVASYTPRLRRIEQLRRNRHGSGMVRTTCRSEPHLFCVNCLVYNILTKMTTPGIGSAGAPMTPGAATTTRSGRQAAPRFMVPAYVGAGAAGLAASVLARPGASCAWTIVGGSILEGSGTHQITFTAGSSGTVRLACVITPPDGGGTTTAEATSTITQ